MRYVLMTTLSLLLALVSACGQREQSPVTSDAALQKRLSGTWISEMEIKGEGHRRCVHVYRADGSYAGEATTVGSNKTSRVSEAGTFLVRDGVLIVTNTKLNGTNAPVPRVDRDRIVRVDDRELVVRSEDRPDVGPVTCRKQVSP
jgi:hypothetical protein